ncbi:MAG: zinc ribbon domain-containing protein [Pseudomonadota bacterium]
MSDPAMRPDPIERIDSAFFWAACERGEFVAQKCAGCGKLWHPPRPICPVCYSTEKTEQKLSGRGVVMSWAKQVRPASFGFAESPIVVLVELEEGLRFVATLEDVDEDSVAAGLNVTVDFAKTSGGKTAPVFRPAGGTNG